ncbi:hypothetical protein WA556_000024 [Blastocystis sp. ATCC 50177/Nand II]
MSIAFSCIEIVSFKGYLDSTQSDGASFLPFFYFSLHCVTSRVMYWITTRRNRHLLEDSEYLVPPETTGAIAFVGCVYYVVICFMTPHLQATHLVVLMQSSCVFSSVIMFLFNMVGWSWIRTCQLLLGLTSLSLIILSLFVTRHSCCIVVLIATILFLVAVVLNSYTIALTTKTLLHYPSLQSQFEFNVYKTQLPMALIVVFLFYSLRNPVRFDFVDVLTFLNVLWTGLLRTFVHTWNWLLLFAYVLSGLLYDACYSRLVLYSNPVVTSVVQVLAFFVTLAVMWAYENAHKTPAHDLLTVVSFALFSILLYWDGVTMPVFRTHRGSFFENKRGEKPAESA